jgi:hypothetical protein
MSSAALYWFVSGMLVALISLFVMMLIAVVTRHLIDE